MGKVEQHTQVKMKAIALLTLSLTVALGMPTFQVDIEENPSLPQGDTSPVVVDWVPVQVHVEAEVNGPQVILSPGKQDISPLSPLVDTQLADVQDLQVNQKLSEKDNPEEKE